MLGQNYFANRLGDIYEYSIIKYKCGKGTSNNSTQYCWELCVDVSGNIIFVLHSEVDFLPLFNSKIQSFSGKSNDEMWNINCTDIHIFKQTEEIFKNCSLFCMPRSVVLTRKMQTTNTPNKARAYLSNFDFSPLDDQRGFFVQINCKDIYFQLLENSKEIIKLIEIRRINNAILSTIDIPINNDENINEIESEIESISWFLSFLNMNLNFTPIIEYYLDNQIIEYSIKNELKKDLKNNYIIDNFKIDQGISKAFIECYYNYKTLQSKIEINYLIAILVEIHQQIYIDLKISMMLIAYEYLLTKYLLDQGRQITDMGDLQQKLQQLNNIMRFIPKILMDDALRISVRNPLFHQGEIPLLSSNEKIDFFQKYYDLLIRIILRILEYTGDYMCRKTQPPSQESP